MDATGQYEASDVPAKARDRPIIGFRPSEFGSAPDEPIVISESEAWSAFLSGQPPVFRAGVLGQNAAGWFVIPSGRGGL